MRDSENLWTERAALVHSEERACTGTGERKGWFKRGEELERIRGTQCLHTEALVGTLAFLKKIRDLTADLSLSVRSTQPAPPPGVDPSNINPSKIQRRHRQTNKHG